MPDRDSNELINLQRRLQEAEDTLEAIRTGEIDALVVKGPTKQEIYTLKSTDYTYRMLIESMSEGALTLSLEGLILYSNARFSEMVSMPLEQIIGQPLQSFVTADDVPGLNGFIRRIPQTGKHEVRLLAGPDTTRDVIISAHDLQFGDNDTVISCIVTDLTQQKQKTALEAAEKLSAQKLSDEKEAKKRIDTERRRLHELLMQAPAFMAVTRGPDHVFELTNAKFMALVKNRDLIDQTVAQALPELATKGFLKYLSYAYQSGTPYIGNEVPVSVTRPGSSKPSRLYLNFIYQPLRDHDDKVDGIIIHAVDVTGQVLAQRRLKQNEQQLSLVFHTIAEGIIIVDPDGYANYANPTAAAILGLSQAEIVARSYEGWQAMNASGRQIPENETPVHQALSTGRAIYDAQVSLKNADGSDLYLSVNAAPLKDSTGKIVGGISSFTDITQRKQLERHKDDFIAIASHELKTPVTSLKIYAQTLQRRFSKQGDADAAGKLAKMDAQLDKLTSLIGELLDVSKLEDGRLPLSRQEYDFDWLVREVTEAMQITTKRHRIITRGSTGKQVLADRERTRQVLTNLIGNAIKYSPDASEVLITLSTDKTNIKVSVRDHGIGIPKEAQEKIFERFYRVGESTRGNFPGLGLGLYISAEIINRMGGRIWVESKDGKGSDFQFTLPIRSAAQTTDSKVQSGNDETLEG